MADNYKAFKKDMKTLKKFMRRLEKFEDMIEAISDDKARVCVGGWVIESYISMLERVYGDKNNWISWFVFENNWGKNGLYMRQQDSNITCMQSSVESIKDLWKLVNDGKNDN